MRLCAHCDRPNTRGPRAKYCTDTCKYEAAYIKLKANPVKYQRQVDRVNARYTPTGRKPRAPRPHVSCGAQGCDKQAHARTMCRLHYAQWYRAQGLDTCPSSAWSDPKRLARAQARAAAKRGASDSAPIIRADIYARDAWTCGLCDKPVDPGLVYPHPMSASLDHIVALARGGAHAPSNVQCAHLRCNIVAQDKREKALPEAIF
jgi:hypothetical protein